MQQKVLECPAAGALFCSLPLPFSKPVSPVSLSFAAMKKILIGFFLLAFTVACNNNDKPTATNPENDLDAARMFIRDALDGRFEQARQLMLRDSTNDQTMDVTERNYEHMSEGNRVGYRNASIQIYNTRNVDDSTRIVTYSNSFKNQKDSLRLVHINNQWLVDLKFTFQERH
jgi:hypothetical protein